MSAKVVELEAYRRKRAQEARANGPVAMAAQSWAALANGATMAPWAPIIVWIPMWRMA